MTTDGFEFSQDGKTLLKCDFPQIGTFVNVPDGCEKIENGVFAEAPIISVSLPNSVKEIGENLFSSSDTLKKVELSNSLANLKPFTFSGCSSLEEISLPENLESFPDGLFFGCSSLQKIDSCKNVNQIGFDVFRDCESLEFFEIPDKVKQIKKGTFAGCTNLQKIILPESLETIEDRSFFGLKSLTQISINGDNKNFFIDKNSGCLYQFTDNGVVLIKCPVNQTSIKLIENTCDVHIDAFDSCEKLEEVFVFENSSEQLVNKIMDLIPHLDVNSYSDEPQNEDSSLDDTDIANINKNTNLQTNIENTNDITNSAPEESELTDFDINIQKEASLDNIISEQNKLEEIDISAIINDQCIRKDSLNEGFTPVTIDELDKLFSSSNTSESVNENSSFDIPEDITTNDTNEDKLDICQYNEEENEIIDNSQIDDVHSTDDYSKDGATSTDSNLSEDDTDSTIDIDSTNDRSKDDYSLTDDTDSTIDTDSTDSNLPENDTDSTIDIESEVELSNNEQAALLYDSDEDILNIDSNIDDENNSIDEISDLILNDTDSVKDSSQDIISKLDLLSKEISKDNITSNEITDPLAQCFNSIEPAIKVEENEPRFIKTLKKLSSHQLVLEEDENKLENVFGDLKDLYVFADRVAPSTNEFSSHLVKFAKKLAKKYGFTKIYFFNDLPLDNPEFIYGLESFGSLRNVLYACDKSNKDSISENQKDLINAAGISLPMTEFKNVKEHDSDEKLDYPVKVLVHDNYVEGLLYCAEKYRKANGIE